MLRETPYQIRFYRRAEAKHKDDDVHNDDRDYEGVHGGVSYYHGEQSPSRSSYQAGPSLNGRNWLAPSLGPAWGTGQGS